jgi:ligand-binding sensor domain-containing protein/serine phosphatase RsbU (regulator of sigma subunit)
MNVLKHRIPVLFILTFLIQNVFGQVYQFKEYNIEEGLSHPFVYNISEDKDGFIWIGTGEGLCKFDGFNFEVSEVDDSLTSDFVSSSFLDKNGILWFGHNSGQITYYDGVQFKLIDTKDFFNSSITDMSGDESGNVFISSQNNGLLRIGQDFKLDTFINAFSGKLIYSLKSIGNNQLLIGTNDGLSLYKINNKEIVEVYTIKELDYITVQTIDDGLKKETFWIGTEDSGFFLLTSKGDNLDSYEIMNIGEKYDIGYENVQSILEDENGVIWISTFGKGIYKLMPGDTEFEYSNVIQFTTLNGLPNNFIKCVHQDWEGNYWIATYGNGLAFSVNEAFTMHYEDISELKGNILSIQESKESLWLSGKGVIINVNKTSNEYQVIDQKNGLPNENIVSIYLDPKNNLWIGTEKSGIYKLNINSKSVKKFYQSNNSLGNSINSITGKKDVVYVSTQNGILVFNVENGSRSLFNTSQGLPHNDIKYVYVDSKNVPWVATNSNGIFALNQNQEYTIEGNANLKFTSIAEDLEGNLWAATYGVGIFKFEKDTLRYYSTDIGLKSNYCYSIIADDFGKIWVGHRLGMSSINVKTDEIKVYGTEIGISGDCNNNSILKRETGEILIGTTHGMLYYDGAKEKTNTFAPQLNITALEFSDKPFDFNKPVNLPYNVYKMRISFVGLSYQNSESVSYQYKLEGYDLEWSNFSKNREAYYPRVEDGNYTFKLKACNADGICVEKPLEITIYIKPPVWKRWWFITLVVLIVIVSIFSYIKYRERKQRALQEYLERELEARTREVVHQKDELEIKNRDITDSINYAQRIQQSILPSINTISKNFSGAFVYYQPRDIVSGDFYWYDRVNDDKFLIVCADSTGHGVPGAFMSMIGTTLIKEICMRKDISSPSDVLQNLDKELQRTLNQNVDAERAHDGMDIIVCEIDVNTHYMRFASAMRPLILYKDNELQYVKGTKASIGGDPKEKKKFENVGFQLTKGDIIYMFSDGYPDQFGGPRGKKFKMDRVKNMLADVCNKEMEIQEEHVDETFHKWRGSLQQVDDVLFMGVQI